MVIRLKDLRDQTSSKKDEPKKSGIVRLADVRKQAEVMQVKSFKQSEKKFGNSFQDPSQSQLMQYIRDNPVIPPQELQSPAHNNLPKSTKPETAVSKNADKASRKVPLIGGVLTDLDRIADSKAAKLVKKVGEVVYTPGATMANIAGFTGAVGKGLLKVVPNLTNSLAGRVANTAIKEAAVGAPLGVGQSLAQGQDGKEALKGGVYGAALGGGLGGVGSALAQGAKAAVNSSVSKIMGNVFQAIHKVGNEVKPVKLKVSSPEEAFQSVIPKVFKDATERMTPPLESETALAKWVQTHLNESGYNSSLKEVENLGYEKLRTISEDIRKEFDVSTVTKQSADDMGYGPIYNKETPTIKQVQAADESARAYGFPAPKVEIQRGNFKGHSTSEFSEIQPTSTENITVQPSKVKRLSEIRKEAGAQENILKSEPKPIEAVADDLIKTKEPRLRDKVYNLLDEQEKAALARLSAKKGRVSSMPIDQWGDHAIVLAAQIGKGGIKLVDATEYLVKEFGEAIRPHAQAILNKSRGIVQDLERRASKEAQDARAFNEADSGDTNTFRGKVSRDPKKDKTSFAQKSEQIRTQFVDDLAPLEGLEKRVSGKVASAEKSLYKSARLFRGVPEKANQIVKDRLAPIVNGIEKQGYNSKDLGDYALAVHAKDVNARDIKSGFTNKEIANVIDQLGTPEMEAARKSLIKVNDDMLKELVDNQVITQDLVDMLKDRYPNYMPLFRQLDDEAVGFEGGLSNALANVTSPIKKLKGSEKQVIDPLENMVKNVFQSTNAAERNKVSLQLSKLYSAELKNKTIRKLGDTEESGSKNIVNVKENGKNVRYEVDSLVIRKLEDFEDVGRKNVVSVLEKGEKVRYEVEPEVYKSLLNLDKESSNMLIKILQKPASLLRAGATLTPEFSLRNPLRDVVQAFVTSNSGFNPIIDFPVGLIQSISKGNLYKKWVDELGAFGNVISNDRQVHKEALERVLKESNGKKFVNLVNGKSLIKLLRAITDVTESATKVGEFRAALRKGTTPEEAAYRSRDIMDFGRAGTNIRETNKIVAFLNANIQGKSKLLRAFKANPAGFTARAFTSITVPTVGIFIMQKYMANESQKKTIDESPAWLTDSFWLVPVPGTDQVARIPKPFDIGTLFSNLPERALKYTYNNDKEAFDGFARKAIADGALPGMISGLTPFIEGMANFSFFRGGSIIPQREDGVNFEDQYDVNTTETAKGLAKVAGKVVGENGPFKNFSSPRIMDNTIKGLTAGLGGYATSAIDVLLDKFNLTDNPTRPAKNVSQKPLAKAFLVNPDQSGESTEQLYNLKTDLTTDKGSAKLRGEEFKDSAKLDYINDQTSIMSDIGKEIRSIEQSKELSSVQKKDKIEVLVKKRNDVAIKAMDYIKSKEK